MDRTRLIQILPTRAEEVAAAVRLCVREGRREHADLRLGARAASAPVPCAVVTGTSVPGGGR